MSRKEKILHLVKSFTVGDIGIIDKIFSFAVYTDKRINSKEYDVFVKVLSEFFEANELTDTDRFILERQEI